MKHVIETVPGTAPINIRPYRVAECHRQKIERQVKGLTDQRVIRRSFSPWNSPSLLVSKRSEDASVKKWLKMSWEWNRLPFGLFTAPGTFVAMMRTILDDVEHTMTYLDDIIVLTIIKQPSNLFFLVA